MSLRINEMQKESLSRPMEFLYVIINKQLSLEKRLRRRLLTHDVYEKQGS